MLGYYKDRTYCASDCVNNECNRFVSDEISNDAIRRGMYIAVSNFSSVCEAYDPPGIDVVELVESEEQESAPEIEAFLLLDHTGRVAIHEETGKPMMFDSRKDADFEKAIAIWRDFYLAELWTVRRVVG